MAIKTVADVANFVIDANKAYYGGLLFLIPQKILDKKINRRNVKKISKLIDDLRFKEQKKLKKILVKKIGLIGNNENILPLVINSEQWTLIGKLEYRKRKIKFFFNVAATIIHL